MCAGRRGVRRPRHRADQAFPAGDAAAIARRLAGWARLPADRNRRPCGRTAAFRRTVLYWLAVAALYDADPVLPLLRVLVRRTGAVAGGNGLDRNLAGAGR